MTAVSLAPTWKAPPVVVTEPGELPREGRRGKADIVHVVLPDPRPNADLPPTTRQDQRTAVNAAHDALEHEHKKGRLEDSAHAAGLIVQRVLERLAANPSGGGQWSEGDRVDVSLSADRKMVRLILNAHMANAFLGEIKGVLGRDPFIIVELALSTKLTLEAIAVRFYGGRRVSERQVYFIAETFRNACRTLAKHLSARGKGKRDDSVEVVEGVPTPKSEARIYGARVKR